MDSGRNLHYNTESILATYDSPEHCSLTNQNAPNLPNARIRYHSRQGLGDHDQNTTNELPECGSEVEITGGRHEGHSGTFVGLGRNDAAIVETFVDGLLSTFYVQPRHLRIVNQSEFDISSLDRLYLKSAVKYVARSYVGIPTC